jgi:hypothetical protein
LKEKKPVVIRDDEDDLEAHVKEVNRARFLR